MADEIDPFEQALSGLKQVFIDIDGDGKPDVVSMQPAGPRPLDGVSSGPEVTLTNPNRMLDVARPQTVPTSVYTKGGQRMEASQPVPAMTRDPVGATKAMGMSLVDPFGATNAMLGAISPEMGQDIRQLYADQPEATMAGSLLTPMGPVGRVAGEAGRVMAAAPKTAAAGLGGLGIMTGATEAGDRIDPAVAQQRIGDIATRMREIDARKEQYGKDKKLSPARTTELNAQLDDERIRLETEQSKLTNQIAEENKRVQMEGAPLRERYPGTTLAATLATIPAAGLATRGVLNKIAGGIDGKVNAAVAAENASDSVNFVRNAEAAKRASNWAPVKATTAGVAAATLPADLQGISDLIDYKTMPRSSRAFEEVAQNYSDPVKYLQSLAPALISGAIGSAAGAKSSKLASGTSRVDAKTLGGSIDGLQGSSTEARAADWAGKRAATLDSENALLAAAERNSLSRRDAGDVRRLEAEASSGALPGSSQTSGLPSQSALPPERQLTQRPEQQALPAPRSEDGSSRASQSPTIIYREKDPRGHMVHRHPKGSPKGGKYANSPESDKPKPITGKNRLMPED